MNAECIVCEKPVLNYKPQYCCNGMDCGCQGLPVEPPICSNKCAAEIYGSATEDEAIEELLK